MAGNQLKTPNGAATARPAWILVQQATQSDKDLCGKGQNVSPLYTRSVDFTAAHRLYGRVAHLPTRYSSEESVETKPELKVN